MVPIWLNNRNRFTTLRGMVEYLQQIPDALPIIIDNASIYPPLLAWYEQYEGEVIRLDNNLGPWAPWILGIDLARSSRYYIVSDSDLHLTGIPLDVLTKLQEGLDTWPKFVKTGLSLEIRDLPEGPIAERVWQCEHGYWQRQWAPGWWEALTDTTFAMYRSEWHQKSQCTGPALRLDRPYTAKHIPWYRRMDDEEKFVEDNTDLKWSSTAAFWRRGK